MIIVIRKEIISEVFKTAEPDYGCAEKYQDTSDGPVGL